MQTRWRQTRLTSARGARDEYSATLSHAGRANVKPANFVAAFLLIAFVASAKLQNEKENSERKRRERERERERDKFVLPVTHRKAAECAISGHSPVLVYDCSTVGSLNFNNRFSN